jgi:hypothetical protein
MGFTTWPVVYVCMYVDFYISAKLSAWTLTIRVTWDPRQNLHGDGMALVKLLYMSILSTCRMGPYDASQVGQEAGDADALKCTRPEPHSHEHRSRCVECST